MILRAHDSLWEPLVEKLLIRSDVETAGLLFARELPTSEGSLFVAQMAFEIPEEAYDLRRIDHIRLNAVALNRLVRPARAAGHSIFTIHTHPHSDAPWFSEADDQGDQRLMPSFQAQVPCVHHGSIVLSGGGTPLGRVFEAARSTELSLRLVGEALRWADPPPAPSEEWFSRQELALGAQGQRLLRSLRVGVVGLGGTGSVVSSLLAHLGAGEIVLMDGDILEASNVSRVIGATPADVGAASKSDIAARYIRALGMGSKVFSHPVFLTGEEEIKKLRLCDIIFSCVDRQTPRALLNRLAYEALLPVIDMGTAFRVDSSGALTGDAGRVVVFGPGRPCLACWGHIDPAALRIEALPAREREEDRQGYIDGAYVPEPSVAAFNAMVASSAVIEFLRLVTRFGGSENPPLRLAFSFREGTVRRNRPPANARCSICSER